MVNLTRGQLQTLINYMDERKVRLINPDSPPPETCKYCRSKPRLGWCTILKGDCVCNTNGCLRQQIREEEPKYTEAKKIHDLETVVRCLSRDCESLEKDKEYNADLCIEKDKALRIADKILGMSYKTGDELHRLERQYKKLRKGS